MRRVEIESPVIQSPVGDDHDESMPDDERQRLQMLQGKLHDAAFSYLRAGSHDPWSVASNEQRFRATVAAHIAGEPADWDADGELAAPEQKMPDFVSRLNLPAGGLGKAQMKLLFGTELAYDKYVEVLTLVDGVQQRELVAAKFRHQLFDLFGHVGDTAISDEIFDMEMEESRLKREVARLHRGDTRAERTGVHSLDDRIAMLAAGSMQPVLRSLIQTALKKRSPHSGQSGAEIMARSIDKRLARPTGAEKRDRHLTEEGPEALEDRAKALLNLCENLRAEMQERSKCGGQAPLLQQRLDVLRESNQGLREVTRGGTEVYPAVALLQSATRGLNMREEEERRLQAEDDAAAARMQSCCMRAVRRQIYLNARQLPCCARGSVARHEYIQCIKAAEVVKNSAKRRRWMIRLEKMREGFVWEDLEELEASEREERARLEAEMQEAEEAARLEALREDEERQAAAAAAARRASSAVKEVENLLKEATTDGSDPQQVQELQERVAQAVAEAERESQLLELQAQRVEAWARQHFSENYLQHLLESEGEERIGPAPHVAGKEHAGKEHGQYAPRHALRAEAHADVEIISLDLAAAERGASRQTLVRSRHGLVSRHGDRHQVAAKCHAAAAAFDRLELLMADPDASKGDVSAALEALQSAQQEAKEAIDVAGAEVAEHGIWGWNTSDAQASVRLESEVLKLDGRGEGSNAGNSVGNGEPAAAGGGLATATDGLSEPMAPAPAVLAAPQASHPWGD